METMTSKRFALALLCWIGLLAVAGAAPRTAATPFKFNPLGVANPCFVDSVRFADTYLDGKKSEGARWVRVLRWGTLEEDYTMGPGHAVAVFQWRGSLFVFDINNGVRLLNVPVAQREDLRAVADAVYSMYPKVKPIGPTALDDSWPTRRPGLRGTDDGPITPAYRDAYRAAKVLSKVREVRLVRFSHREKGKLRQSAAAVFLLSRQLCVYVPERGTMVLRQMIPNIDDDNLIRARLVRSFGPAAEVRLGLAEKPSPTTTAPAKKPSAKAKKPMDEAAPVVSPAPPEPPE